MAIELIPATMQEHDIILRNLYQFYLYEFSRFTTEWRVQHDGRFAETDLEDCWDDLYRRIFLIYTNKLLAGFAIIDIGIPEAPGSVKTVNEISEFYIMPPYQKQGIGASIAEQLFKQFRGQWEITIVDTNLDALAFWRKVIERYAQDQFREHHRPEEQDFLLSFNNGEPIS